MKRKDMLVEEVMKKKVITVRRGTTLKELIEIFGKFTFHTLPVIEKDNKLVGVIALEDIFKIFEPYPSHILEMLERVPFLDEYGERSLLEVDIPPELGVLCVVDDLMNKNVITISEEMTTFEARSLMKLHKVRRLPVVDEEGHLIGIVSLFDIILAVFRKKGILQ